MTALLPAVGSEGYLVLDSAAEIWSVLKKGIQAVTSLAQSTSALQLDTVEEPTGDLLRLVENQEEAEEMEEIQPPTDLPIDDDDDENPVVTQQQLSEVFDIGPSFALAANGRYVLSSGCIIWEQSADLKGLTKSIVSLHGGVSLISAIPLRALYRMVGTQKVQNMDCMTSFLSYFFPIVRPLTSIWCLIKSFGKGTVRFSDPFYHRLVIPPNFLDLTGERW